MVLPVLFSCTFLLRNDAIKIGAFVDWVISLLLYGIVMYMPTKQHNLLTVS